MHAYRHLSLHRRDDGLIECVERNYKPEHIAAGYGATVWGEVAHPDHELLGDHAIAGSLIRVVYVENLLSSFEGPAFLVTFPGGAHVDAICADTVRDYLELARRAANSALNGGTTPIGSNP